MKKGKKSVEGKQKEAASSSYNDERFSHIANNPIFRRVPAKEKRIDVDERFHSMFHDSKFNLNSKVDKRGKPVTAKSDKRLATYYTAVGEDKKEKKVKKVKQGLKIEDTKETVKKISKDKQDRGSSDSGSEEVDSSSEENDLEENNDANLGNYKSVLTADIKKKLRDANIDYARGDHAFASEESSSEDSSDSEKDDDDTNLMHEWGEIDKDAPRTEEATSRLALCNMDWDNLRAVDLLILFNSFVPAEGVLKDVSIYPSEFGKERMAEEEINGPKELSETVIDRNDDNSGEEYEEDDVNEFQMEKLRKYQLNRLKYYYAVLQFDSAEAAEKVYSECDGMEFESSATRIDLRFIPEDMTFEDEPKDKCDELPTAEKYRPRLFTTTALQQIKVDLTWDETDPMRKELTEMMFDPKAKVDDEDLVAYLASSSSESEDELQVEENAKELEKSSQKDRLAKYRSLLEGIEQTKSKEKEGDVQMEITWGIGLKKKTEELVKKKNEEKDAKDRTPWEEMLAKQKDKKKQKRKEKNKKISEDSEEDSEQPFSDDDVDVDLNDDFFKDEIKSNNIKREKSKKPDDATVDSEANKAALELLMMDDDDNKSHFSLKKIMADSAEKPKKKRKGKPVKESKTVTDNFEINVSDDRFSALFSSHHFNVDPSDPNYKKTKAMEKIISEKLKRRPKMLKSEKNVEENDLAGAEKNTAEKSASENASKEKFELQSLVKSIKRKAENMKNDAKQKQMKK